MIIRDYKQEDSKSWLRCRVLSFLTCSYYDDIQREQEKYENPVIRLVAVDGDQVIGFIDCEYENNAGDVCHLKQDKRGAVIWNLGVLPEYQNQKIATQLWETAKERLQGQGIERVEVWTQDDVAANKWYQSRGFEYIEGYLNAYLRGTLDKEVIQDFINTKKCGEISGVRSLNFEAPLERKSELEKICYRLHEVRMYHTYI